MTARPCNSSNSHPLADAARRPGDERLPAIELLVTCGGSATSWSTIISRVDSLAQGACLDEQQ